MDIAQTLIEHYAPRWGRWSHAKAQKGEHILVNHRLAQADTRRNPYGRRRIRENMT